MRQIAGVIGSVFAPGFGAALHGRRARAAWWLGAGLVALAATWWTVWGLVGVFAIGAASGADSWRLAPPPPAEPQWTDAGAAFGIFAIASALFGMLVIEAFKVPSSSMCPTLCTGDHIFVDKLSAKLHAPRPGEIIAFRQPCEERVWLKRVVAHAGDTVEVRCSVVYVNGKALPTGTPTPCHYSDVDESRGTWEDRGCSDYPETLGGHAYHTIYSPDRLANDGRPIELREPYSHDFPRLEGERAPPRCGDSGTPAADGVPVGTIVETKSPGKEPTVCDPQLAYKVPDGALFVMGDNRDNSNDSRYWGAVPLANVIGYPYAIWMPGGEHWGDRDWDRFGAVQ